MSHVSFITLAEKGYMAYCKTAGGKTFDGKPLPTWVELGAERQSCWIAATQAIVANHAVVH